MADTMPPGEPAGIACPRPLPPYDPRAAIGRVLLSLVVGVGTSFLVSHRFGWATRIVGGWDVGATTLLGTVWFVIAAADPEKTRCRAASADPGQGSDVTITSPQIRRVVLGHALLSFAYNTVILALALNLLFGILS